jgi:hypothetical protein
MAERPFKSKKMTTKVTKTFRSGSNNTKQNFLRDKDGAPKERPFTLGDFFGSKNASNHQSITSSDELNSEDETFDFKVVLDVDILNERDAYALVSRCNKTSSPFQSILSGFKVEGKAILEESDSSSSLSLVLATKSYAGQDLLHAANRIFEKKYCSGFLPWLGGEKGWRFDDDATQWKQGYLFMLNSLQEVFKLYAPDNVLYVQGTSKALTWKKATSLQSAVHDIRKWMEVICPQNELLRTSKYGPDAPIHWAAHGHDNRYPITIVSRKSMTELVKGLIAIFQVEFIVQSSSPIGPQLLGTHWYENPKRKFDWKKKPKDLDGYVWSPERLQAILNGTEWFIPPK